MKHETTCEECGIEFEGVAEFIIKFCSKRCFLSNKERRIHKPVVVDMDLIRQMRLEKRFNEAEELLRAFRATCEKNKKLDSRTLINKDNRIKSFIKLKNKTCIDCGKYNPIPMRKRCEDCRIVHSNKNSKDYYKSNRESIKEKHRAYSKLNRKAISEYRKQYYKENKEMIKLKAKVFYQKHRVELIEYSKQYRKRKKEDAINKNKE